MKPTTNRVVGAILNHIVIPAINDIRSLTTATINIIKTIADFDRNTLNLEWQGLQWVGNMDVQVINSGLHSKDRNVRAFVECSITAGVAVGTALALYYGQAPVSALIAYVATQRSGLDIPRFIGPPVGGFLAGEYQDALAHLAYEGAEAFGPIAIGCGSDLAGIAYDATYGSGAIPL